MDTIFKACDRLNVQVAIYRSSGTYAGEMRWSCTFIGGDEHVKLEADATATAADAAIELAWHRFQKLASGQMEAIQAIANEAVTPLHYLSEVENG